jgi:hydroxypyruvate reductase
MPTPNWSNLRADLAALQQAALAAADPERAVERALAWRDGVLAIGPDPLPLSPSAAVRLVAFGKAAPGMARAAFGLLGERIVEAVVAHPRALEPGLAPRPGLRIFAASHPTPDAGSLAAGAAALELAARAEPGDLVLVLVSGGGSALFEALRPGVTLEDLAGVTLALQHAGADIVELNTVRRALSRVKGGGLARAAGRATVAALLLSDVMGDPPAAIASGPTVPSPTGPADALAVLERRGLVAGFPAVAAALGSAGAESPAGAPAAQGPRLVRIVGSNRIAARALCDEAAARGFTVALWTDRLQGEAREVGRLLGGIARGVREGGIPLAAPACLVLGGETTVTVRGRGQGGRNLELALGAALTLDGCAHAAVFSFATDGMDGSSGAAGAVVTGDTLARAAALGLSAGAAFAASDTAPFFRALDDLVVTGPSGTNVNDLAVVLVYG